MPDDVDNFRSPGGPDPVRPAPPADEVRRWVDALLDDRIDPVQRRALEDRVVADPAVAELYLEMVHLSCCLPLHVTRAALDLKAAEGEPRASSLDETMILPGLREADLPDEAPWAMPEPTFPPPPRARVGSALGWRQWGGLAAVLAVAVSGFHWWQVTHRPDGLAGVGPVAEIPVTPPAVPPAVLTATADSSDPVGTPSPGSTLGGGQELDVADGGAVEITFARGSVVVVQGPAKFQVTDGNSMRLEAGALSAHVPVAARGFAVTAPGLVVVDRGTDFGVRLLAGGAGSAIYVFRGAVDLTPLDEAGRPTAAAVRAVGGQAFSHEASADGLVAVPSDPTQFTRDVAGLRVPVRLHNTGDAADAGAADPNWQVVSVPNDPAWEPRPANVLGVLPTAYASNAADGKWVGVTAGLENQPPGEFDFRTTVDLAGRDPSTVAATARVAADNGIADVLINGVSTGLSTPATDGPFDLATLTVPPRFWKPGLNQVDVIVRNTPDPPTGGGTMVALRVQWTARASPVVRRSGT